MRVNALDQAVSLPQLETDRVGEALSLLARSPVGCRLNPFGAQYLPGPIEPVEPVAWQSEKPPRFRPV